LLHVAGDVPEKVGVEFLHPDHPVLIAVLVGLATGPGDPILQALPGAVGECAACRPVRRALNSSTSAPCRNRQGGMVRWSTS
jgi:hypothetical protein